MVRYVVEGLSQANQSEDVVFNIGGYGKVAADLVSEKYWTAGRIFYANDKLNILKSGDVTASALEQRLATLQELEDKDPITDDEFQDRRQATLEEL